MIREVPLARAALGSCLLLAAAGASAQSAGEVEFSRGRRLRPDTRPDASHAGQGPCAEGRRPAHHRRRRVGDHQAGRRHPHDRAAQLRAGPAAVPLQGKRAGQQHADAVGARRLSRCHRADCQELAQRCQNTDAYRHHRHPRHRFRRPGLHPDCGAESAARGGRARPTPCRPAPK